MPDFTRREYQLLDDLPYEIRYMLYYAFPSNELLRKFLQECRYTTEYDSYYSGMDLSFSNLSISIEMDSMDYACITGTYKRKTIQTNPNQYLCVAFNSRGGKYRIESQRSIYDILDGSSDFGFSIMRLVLYATFMIEGCSVPINVFDNRNLFSVLSCLEDDVKSGSDVMLKLYLEHCYKFGVNISDMIECCQNNDMLEFIPVVLRVANDKVEDEKSMRL